MSRSGCWFLGLWIALTGLGCGSHPLGEDWSTLEEPDRAKRVQKLLSEAISGGVDGAGNTFQDREVVSCDLEQVVYRPKDDEAGTSTLRWADVEAVRGQTLSTLPSRPETLMVYLAAETPSLKTVRDLNRPTLTKVGLAQPYVLLRSRRRWARNRLVKSLAYLRRRRIRALKKRKPKRVDKTLPPAEEKTLPPAEEKTLPPAEERTLPPKKGSLDAVEVKLKRLKEWYDKKLITKQEYETKKKKLLEGL